MEEKDITIRFTKTPTLNAGTCTRSRVILTSWIHQGGSMEQYMWKKRVITIVCTETPTLNAGTCTRSRVITHLLDSSRRIHGAINVEEKG